MANVAAIHAAQKRLQEQQELEAAKVAWDLERNDTLQRDMLTQLARLGGKSTTAPPGETETSDEKGDTADDASSDDLPLISFKLPFQKHLYVFYNSTPIQMVTAGLIFANFIVNAAEAQYCGSNASCYIDEDGFKGPLNEREGGAEWYANQTATYALIHDSENPKDWNVSNEGAAVFEGFELFFTFIFLLELIINFWGHYWRPFIASGWNWFDTVVVTVSVISLAVPELPGVSTLRLMRAFRVFRLFKRLQSLRKIMSCLGNAIPGCMSAFFIVVLITAIYAILGVEFFSTLDSVVHPGTLEPHGPYYFGDFSSAMFTMFQVMTGESWAEMIARPLVDAYPLSSLYFVSYILIVGLVLINVVVAVLLEKMGGADEDEYEEGDKEDDPQLLQRKYITWTTTRTAEALAERLDAQDQRIDRLAMVLEKLEAKLT